MKRIVSALAVLLLGVTVQAQAEDVSKDYLHVEVLLDKPTSIVGETIAYPGGMPADISSAIVTIDPGEETGWHKHGVPLYVYILSGEVTVDYGDKGVKVYKAGTAFMEAMDQFHNGKCTSKEPVRILTVYMGGNGQANVIHQK